MDQSDTRHLLRLPVLDCPQVASLGADLASYAQELHGPVLPSVAEQAASLLAAHAPTAAPAVPMPEDMRNLVARLRADEVHTQAEEWNAAPMRLRALLVKWAELRALHPTHTMHELAARSWQEVPHSERAMLAGGVRVLVRLLTDMGRIGKLRA